MDFDLEALRFYLEHEEATRLEREKFLNGEEVDLAIIPRGIYNSWVRSAAFGVNPYVTDVPAADGSVPARNTEQFFAAYQSPYNGLDFFRRKFRFQVFFTDRNGYTVSDEDPRAANPAAVEQNIGTTSAAMVLAERKSATCFGYQNYKLPHCRQFCLSAPALNKKGDFLGAVTVMLSPEELTQERYEQAISILELLQVFYRASYANQNATRGALELLWEILPQLSDGVILTNTECSEGKWNPAAGELLELSQGADISAVSAKLKALRGDGRRGPKCPKAASVELVHHQNQTGQVFLLRSSQTAHTETAATQNKSAAQYTFRDMIGEDPAYLRAKREAYIVAPTTAAVMLLGESGVGKELFAQSIHNASSRKSRPFVAINCGAVPRELLASELFGYEPGAFTGASAKGKVGVMEAASGGTLFLDEIESMPLYHQSALLRSLSSGTIRRVGGVQDIPIDIRVISATKVDLRQVPQSMRQDWGVAFRSDLYYRLSTCKIHIPALREHRQDIAVLTRFLVEKKKRELNLPHIALSDSFLDALYYYDWPGNIRELENVVTRAVIFMDPEKQVLTRSLLYPELLAESDHNRLQHLQEEQSHPEEREPALRAEEEMTIQRYLLQNDCNVKVTAERLGISRQSLYRKIRSSEVLSRLIQEEKSRKRTASR